MLRRVEGSFGAEGMEGRLGLFEARGLAGIEARLETVFVAFVFGAGAEAARACGNSAGSSTSVFAGAGAQMTGAEKFVKSRVT